LVSWFFFFFHLSNTSPTEYSNEKSSTVKDPHLESKERRKENVLEKRMAEYCS
jgi:hypothetical protein